MAGNEIEIEPVGLVSAAIAERMSSWAGHDATIAAAASASAAHLDAAATGAATEFVATDAQSAAEFGKLI